MASSKDHVPAGLRLFNNKLKVLGGTSGAPQCFKAGRGERQRLISSEPMASELRFSGVLLRAESKE